MTDDQARVRVDATGNGTEIKLILIDSSNDQDLCTLAAKLLPPNQAEIASGQPCFGSEDDSFELAVHVRSGIAKLQDAALSINITLDADVTSDQLQAHGSVEYQFDGRH
jgi:hypothetical protein